MIDRTHGDRIALEVGSVNVKRRMAHQGIAHQIVQGIGREIAQEIVIINQVAEAKTTVAALAKTMVAVGVGAEALIVITTEDIVRLCLVSL